MSAILPFHKNNVVTTNFGLSDSGSVIARSRAHDQNFKKHDLRIEKSNMYAIEDVTVCVCAAPVGDKCMVEEQGARQGFLICI